MGQHLIRRDNLQNTLGYGFRHLIRIRSTFAQKVSARLSAGPALAFEPPRRDASSYLAGEFDLMPADARAVPAWRATARRARRSSSGGFGPTLG